MTKLNLCFIILSNLFPIIICFQSSLPENLLTYPFTKGSWENNKNGRNSESTAFCRSHNFSPFISVTSKSTTNLLHSLSENNDHQNRFLSKSRTIGRPIALKMADPSNEKDGIEFVAADDGDALQDLFSRICDNEGLMTKEAVKKVPSIAQLLVSTFHHINEYLLPHDDFY